jgi:hypothetical protein
MYESSEVAEAEPVKNNEVSKTRERVDSSIVFRMSETELERYQESR